MSAPLAILTSNQLDRVVALQVLGVGGDSDALARADRHFNDMAAMFFLVRTVADAGMLIGYVAGLVWLYQVWENTSSRRKGPTMSPRAAVLWSLVPVWGVVRVHEFLLRIAQARGVRPEALKPGLWACSLLLYMGLRVATAGQIGGVAVVDSVAAVCAALLGIRIVWRLQRSVSSAR